MSSITAVILSNCEIPDFLGQNFLACYYDSSQVFLLQSFSNILLGLYL